MNSKDIQSILNSLKIVKLKLNIISREFGRYDEIKASLMAKKEVKTNEHRLAHNVLRLMPRN